MKHENSQDAEQNETGKYERKRKIEDPSSNKNNISSNLKSIDNKTKEIIKEIDLTNSNNDILRNKLKELKEESKRLETKFKNEYKSFINNHHKNQLAEIENYFNIGVKYGFINSEEHDSIDFIELANFNLLNKIESNNLEFKDILKKIICKKCKKEGFKMHSIKENRIACLNCHSTKSIDKCVFDVNTDKYFEIKTIQLLLERISVSKIAKVLGKDPAEIKRTKLKYFKFINELIGSERIYGEDVTSIDSSLKKFKISGVNNLILDFNKTYEKSNQENLSIEKYLINSSLIKIDPSEILKASAKRVSGVFLVEVKQNSFAKIRKGIATLIITEKGTRRKRSKKQQSKIK